MARRRRPPPRSGEIRHIGEILSESINSPSFPAIPTTYAGIEFRSRLEATWAAFFDLCGWKWSFEPLDMNGWIPDFGIGHEPTLVEVKPFYRLDQWPAVTAKIAAASNHRLVVLLGADPTHFSDQEPDSSGAPQLGWLLQNDGLGEWVWPLNFGFIEGCGCDDHSLGLCPMDGPWVNIIWNPPTEYRANKHSRVWGTSRSGYEATEVLREHWNAAKNATKWKRESRND